MRALAANTTTTRIIAGTVETPKELHNLEKRLKNQPDSEKLDVKWHVDEEQKRSRATSVADTADSTALDVICEVPPDEEREANAKKRPAAEISTAPLTILEDQAPRMRCVAPTHRGELNGG